MLLGSLVCHIGHAIEKEEEALHYLHAFADREAILWEPLNAYA
jgi:hypothetical protein